MDVSIHDFAHKTDGIGPTAKRAMKVAIVHDFLVQMGGAEKVVEALHEMFPNAPVFTSAYDPSRMPAQFQHWDIRTTFLQKLPCKRISHRLALLLYPIAFESLELSEYDLVISSSSAFAKGVITQPGTVHLSYTHTPMRYAWMTRSYLKRENMSYGMRMLLAPALHRLRTWDAVASSRVDHYLANSSVVSERIRKFYRRDSQIVFPPVDTSRFRIAPEVGNYYLIAARFVPYKRLDLAIEACSRLQRPLKVVGDGRQSAKLRALSGPHVEFLGRVSDAELTEVIAHAKAYIMPGEEDFGISAVEANACGRPVIAYGAGGALDSQVHGVTGVLFHEQTVESLCDAIRHSECLDFDPKRIRAHAMRFDTGVFIKEIRRVITAIMEGDEERYLPADWSDMVVSEKKKSSAPETAAVKPGRFRSSL